MRKRNLYKDIVMLALGILCFWALVRGVDFWIRQQKSYGISIQSEAELTEDIVKEIAKIEGVYAFLPISSCSVRLRLQAYTLETQVLGVDLYNYPFQWKQAQEEITLGNTVVLFVGQETFSGFADDHGNHPGKSEIAQWMEQYQELELTVTDDKGRERKAYIGGMIEEPSSGLYMSEDQMQELYPLSFKRTAGHMKICGEKNMQKAKERLSEAGFQVE